MSEIPIEAFKIPLLLKENLVAFERVLTKRYAKIERTNTHTDITYRIQHPISSTTIIRLIHGRRARQKEADHKFCLLYIICESRTYNENGNLQDKIKQWGKCYDIRNGRPPYRRIAANISSLVHKFESNQIVKYVMET